VNFAKIRLVLPLVAAAAVVLLPGVASADTFSWTFGGGSDPVSGSGTLTAVATADAGIDFITGGSGTVTDVSGTYNVTFLALTEGTGNEGLCSDIWGEGWTPASAHCGTLHGLPGAGGADYPFDNLLYLNALPSNSELDANGIVLYNAAGPAGKSYFDVWSSGISGNPLPDNLEWSELNPYSGGSSTNFLNPFTVTADTSATPEPATMALMGGALLGLGLLRKRFRKD
jgi:hypothetical protein